MSATAEAKTHGLADVGARFHRSGIYVFLISFVSLYYILNTPVLLAHYDLGWHLAAGDLIRDQGHIPFADPWSFTSAGRQWFNLSWLGDVIASAIFRYASFGGLIFLVVVCGAVIVAYLASACLSSGASSMATSISVFSACLLYPAFATVPTVYLSASPNTYTMVFAAIFYVECLKRTRRVLLLPAVMVLWANLHGGFVLRLPIVGVFAGVALLKRDWASFRLYSAALVGCVVATLINPLGWHIYAGVATTVGHFVQAYIDEWLPYYHNIAMPGSIPGIIYIVIFISLELSSRRLAPIEPRLLSWIFLVLGLYQFRYLSFFFMFSTVPLALQLDRLLPKQPKNLRLEATLLAAGLMAACVLPFVYMQIKPALELPQMFSQQDAEYLQSHFPHARLLNHWNYGGNLIRRTGGAIAPFVDGRGATAYPDDLLRDYFRLAQVEVDETAWDAVLKKYQIDTVLWVKAHDQLRRFLVGKRGWKEVYAGLYASIYVKPPPDEDSAAGQLRETIAN